MTENNKLIKKWIECLIEIEKYGCEQTITQKGTDLLLESTELLELKWLSVEEQTQIMCW